MTCIKTGARVSFPQYGQILSADIYAIADAVVIRANPDALEGGYGLDIMDATHEVHSNFGGANEFWRDDIGVFVVPKDNLKTLK